MAQACLGILLWLDEHTGNRSGKGFPLVGYAAEHWVEHARLETVAPRVRDGMDDLFNSSKLHFAAWLRVHDFDHYWPYFSPWPGLHDGSPLYCAALCGLFDLASRLILKHPEQVNAVGGHIVAPLPAALHKRHFRVADLLHRHGAVVDIQGDSGRTPLYCASIYGNVDIMQWLCNHGADANVPRDDGRTPLHTAAVNMQLEAVQSLLDHNAYVNSQDEDGGTPLSTTIDFRCPSSEQQDRAVDVVRLLLEHGADPNVGARGNPTLLHQASSHGWLEVARLLHKYGAKVDEKDEEGKTPFQIASEKGYDEIAKLLSEHADVPQL
jgi:ankyrin repeat protein